MSKIPWVNALKSIGIIAVIIGHTRSPLSPFVFTWHLPLFFFIAGFFIKFESKFSVFLISSFKRLMLPYFIFTTVGFFVEVFKRNTLGRPQIDLVKSILGIFYYMDMEALLYQYGFVLWFLPALFWARILLYVAKTYSRNNFLALFVILSCSAFGFFYSLPFCLDKGLFVAPLLFCGFLFFEQLQNRRVGYFIASLSLALLIILPMPALDLALKKISNLPLNLIYAACVISLLILISKAIIPLVKNNNLINSWGEETLILFIVHPYTNNIGHIISSNFGGEWFITVLVSLVLLHGVLLLKSRFKNFGFFKYV